MPLRTCSNDDRPHEGRIGSAAGGVGSVLLHGSLLLALAAASWLQVKELPAREWRETITFPPITLSEQKPGNDPESDSPPPRAAPGTHIARQELPGTAAQPELPHQESELEVARDVPVTPALDPPAPGPPGAMDAGLEADGPRGDPEGLPGGHRDGTPGGTWDGQPGGRPGGTGSGSGNGWSGAQEADTIYIDGRITPPQPLRQIRPEYPKSAREARVGATLLLQIVVDEHGEIAEIKVLRSHPLFESAAVDAVRQWRYSPAMLGGRAVRVYLLVTVEFKLL